jgi:glyoxylase I family protein
MLRSHWANRLSTNHLSLQRTQGSPRFDELRPGLDHIGFTCSDRSELERLQARLDELGIQHGGIAEDALGHGLSFRDPDDIALEFWAPRT